MENFGTIIFDQETYTDKLHNYLLGKDFNRTDMPEAKFTVRIESRSKDVIFNYHNFPIDIINKLVEHSKNGRTKNKL